MNATHVANTTRLVALAAAVLVTAVEWAAFAGILLLADPARIAGVSAADLAPAPVLPEVVVTAHGRG